MGGKVILSSNIKNLNKLLPGTILQSSSPVDLYAFLKRFSLLQSYLEWNFQNPPRPHGFANEVLQSGPDLSEIVTEINTLLPQLADFISKFHNVVNQYGINVMTDAAHNMSIDVPSDIPEAQRNSINNRISILDRCIKTRSEQIAEFIEKGRNINYKIRMASESNSEFMRQIEELRRLNASYLH